jgi:CubicO group peptidase (beta-lactamase class C family)
MLLLRALSVLLLLAWATASPAAGQDRRVARLREYLTAAANLGQLNASVLIAERGTVLADTAYGFADMELGVRSTPGTRFRVASVTKQFTAMAIVMLAEDGKLDLGDPISKYLDSLPPSWSAITIHHLLRHTSGISDYEEWFDGYTTQAYSDYMSQAHAPARILRDAKARPLDHEPGTKFRYSNSAYIILGFIIERAGGMPYADFLRTRIHQPLGMTLSDQDRSEEITPNRAQGYRLRPGAYPRAYFSGLTRTDYLNAVYQLMEPPQADAGLITTARDLYRWDQALYTEKLVKRALIDSIFTPGIGDYGYGWFVRSGPDGITHDHSGGLPGFSCYIRRIPGSRRTIIILGNLERLGRTVGDVTAILRGDSVAVPRARRILATDSARDARLTGMYRTAGGDSVRVFIGGASLGAHQPGAFRAALLPESAQDYFVVQLNGTAQFRESDGRTTLVIRDALGREMVRAVRPANRPASSSRYLIYLHGRIVEEQGRRPTHADFGTYQYDAILDSLRQAGFTVLSEQRPPGIAVDTFASRLVRQVDSLLQLGVPPQAISVIGFSRGGAIALLASSRLRNPAITFVFMGACGDWAFERADIRVTGRLLSIYETSDTLGASCAPLFARRGPGSETREVPLSLGLGHGTFFQPRSAWLRPALAWARGNAP